MGSFSLVHWIVLILVVILLFGRGRISDLMGDLAKGITSFKKGLAEGETPPAAPKAPPAQIPDASQQTTPQASTTEDARR
jgi:sec-independent protein translocase protein TatA